MNKKSRPFYYFVTFVVIYLVLTIVTPPNKAVLHQYHISAGMARLLSTSVVLPLIGIWFAAFYGFAKLNNYAKLIRRDKDGQHINSIARGVTILAVSLPVGGVITSTMNLWAQHHPSFLSASSIISGYISLVLPLAAFMTISSGVRGLTDSIKQRPPRSMLNTVALAITILSVIYCYFIFTNNHIRTIYHLPFWVLSLTIVIPYIFLWFVGLFAASEIFVYAGRVPGIIYRKGWKLLAAGLGAVIITSVALQYLVTLTDRLTHLKIGSLLLIIYALLLVLASGYIAIALGAQKLQKIEEV